MASIPAETDVAIPFPAASSAPQCPDHPNDKRAANGKCIGCIVDRSNRRAADSGLTLVSQESA
jgi:hypothetical protein